MRFAPKQAAQIVAETDVLLLCNPNNPSGHRYAKQDLLAWRQALAERGGWLIVDEAFIDSTPEHSLAAEIGTEGLIVLRSLGKFFGLAGARVGFMLAWPELLQVMAERLGPWPISGPARIAATQALADTAWQTAVKNRLQQDMLRLTALLIKNDLHPKGVTTLYQWVMTPQAPVIHEQLAQMGILTRLFAEPVSLRFGLPGAEAEWQKLADALHKLTK
jgi:cobalamin biosynthetic protein CobC